MRVALINPFLFREPRGIERFTCNLSAAFAAREIETHLITWRWPRPIIIETLASTVRLHLMPTPRYYTATAMTMVYAWHLWRQAYDFVWIYFADYGEAEALTLVPRQAFGIILHYPLAQTPHRYRGFQRLGLARRAAHIVSTSQYVASGAEAFFERSTPVITSGVDAAIFAPNPIVRQRLRCAQDVPEGAPVLLTVAALEERKGIQWVVRALVSVVSRFPQAHYWVLGEGPYRGALEELVRDLALTPYVRFWGAQADIKPFYQAADIALLMSHGEASPLALLEALACGLPVITSLSPPYDELVRPGYGVRVHSQDTEALAEVMMQLIGNPARRQSLGTAGRAAMQSEFAWERIAARYQQLMTRA